MIGSGRYDNSRPPPGLLSAPDRIEFDPDEISRIEVVIAWHGGTFRAASHSRP
jgi:hypothetical protein